MKSSRVPVHQGEIAGDIGSHYVVNMQNSIFSHLPCATAEGGQSGLEVHEKNLGLVALGRELMEQPPGSLCYTIPHTAEANVLRQNTALQVASA